MLGIFKRKRVNKNSLKAFYKVRPTIPVSELRVLRAIQHLQPCHYRQVSEHLRIIEGSVTPRIRGLRNKNYVKVAYVNKGSSGTQVNYYEITGKGIKYLIDKLGKDS